MGSHGNSTKPLHPKSGCASPTPSRVDAHPASARYLQRRKLHSLPGWRAVGFPASFPAPLGANQSRVPARQTPGRAAGAVPNPLALCAEERSSDAEAHILHRGGGHRLWHDLQRLCLQLLQRPRGHPHDEVAHQGPWVGGAKGGGLAPSNALGRFSCKTSRRTGVAERQRGASTHVLDLAVMDGPSSLHRGVEYIKIISPTYFYATCK